MPATTRRDNVPPSPRVISPSPSPSDHDHTGPVTRSAARRKRQSDPSPPSSPTSSSSDVNSPGHRRSRTRSRSPNTQRMTPRKSNKSTPVTTVNEVDEQQQDNLQNKKKHQQLAPQNGKATISNSHLAPPQPSTLAGWNWRDFSRSPSPLGLIPIHRHWRTFVHKHEVPRKALHVSIGFFVLALYVKGVQTSTVPPYLMAALVPITTTELLRHRYESVNRLYVKCLGALMRESEFSGWNGVIFYLLGTWIVLYFLPKDVAVVSVLLLSWCDTAASTFGRLWGRYTPRLRRGKSLAGSLAAFVVGVATSHFFYGFVANTIGPVPGDEYFMFRGALTLPSTISNYLGLTESQSSITGSLALGAWSLFCGFAASASEVVDLFGWDDNLTIPVLSGAAMWGFLKVFT